MATEINLSEWTLTGGGMEAESYYNISDTTLLLKLYHKGYNFTNIEKEHKIAKLITELGIPTPDPGDVVTYEGRTGLIFKKIENKRSFCRIISEQPERLEEIALKFAEEVKRLHTIPIRDSKELEDYRDFEKGLLASSKLSEKRIKQLESFLDRMPEAQCYSHGDLHFGNIITDGIKDYFIDLSRFSLGTPDYDIAMMGFIRYFTPAPKMKSEFHITRKQAKRFYEIFLEQYFEGCPDKQIHLDNIRKWTVFRVETLAAIIGLPSWLIYLITFNPGMIWKRNRILFK